VTILDINWIDFDFVESLLMVARNFLKILLCIFNIYLYFIGFLACYHDFD